MLFKRTSLFRFFGFDVKADASWIFISVLFAWTMAANIYPALYPGHSMNTYQLMGLATLAGLLASIIAHEVAHAIVAEYYHMPIASITLFIFGGVAEMEGEPSHPKGEFLMALAGPAMSAIAGVFFLSTARLYETNFGAGPVAQTLDYLGTINMLLVAFNLIPAFPLDGGRALRAVIWRVKKNFVLATRIASEMGSVLAYGLFAWACYMIVCHDNLVMGMWNGLFGLFVYGAGAYAVRQTEGRSLLGAETVARFMHGQAVTVTPDLIINDFVEGYVYKHYQRSFPVVDQGRLLGVIMLQSILSMARHKWHWLHVASVMEPLSEKNVVTPDSSAADAFEMMQKTGQESLLVAEDGKYLGIIAFRDLAAYLSITMKIDHNKPVAASRGI